MYNVLEWDMCTYNDILLDLLGILSEVALISGRNAICVIEQENCSDVIAKLSNSVQ